MTYDDVIMNRLKQDGIYECVVEMFKTKQAEIERLRAALREVKVLSHSRSPHPMSAEADYFRIAHTALGENK